MAQKETGNAQHQKEEDSLERIKVKHKFTLALGLFTLFGVVLITSIFVLKDTQSVISVAGIFSAWIGAIIAFYYMEHQSTERVREARQSEKSIRADLENIQIRVPELQSRGDDAIRETRRTLDELAQQLEKERKERHKLENELEQIYAKQGAGVKVAQQE